MEVVAVVVVGEGDGEGVVLELPPSPASGEAVVPPPAPSEGVTELLEPSVLDRGISVKGTRPISYVIRTSEEAGL